MSNNLSYAQSIASDLKGQNANRNLMFEAMEQMYHNKWELPPEMKALDWVRKVVSTDPHDAIEAGVRVLSSLPFRPKMIPNADNKETKDQANIWERVLINWLQDASRRKRATVVRDVVRSALMYDMVAAQVYPIEYQRRLAKEQGFGINTKQLDFARQHGPFAITLFNPKGIYPAFSDYGPTAVYSVRRNTLGELIGFWGADRGKEMKARWYDDKDPAAFSKVMYTHEVTTLDQRTVWITGEASPTPEGMVVLDVDMDLPFFPWVISSGGTNLEDATEYQYKPMLASVFQAEQWDIQNIVDTLWISDIIATAAAGKYVVTGPNPAEAVNMNYADPGGRVEVKTGHTATPNPPRPADTGLLTVSDHVTNRVQKSTVAKILMGADLPTNTQWATINLATQTALGSLKPPKEVAENALSDICAMMLRWFAFMGGEPTIMTGRTKIDAGMQYELDPATIDTENLLITGELTPDVPTDKLQKINAAAIAVQSLGYTKEAALEEIGVQDPARMLKDGVFEKLQDALLQAQTIEITGAAQARIQAMVQQFQMRLQMEMEAEKQRQLGAQNMPMQAGVGGPGFNPALGGTPAQAAYPELTREAQNANPTGV